MSLIDYHRKMLADPVRHEAFSKALQKIIEPGKTTVADIGSGTGILSFLALKLGAKHATLYETGDVMEVSKKLAKENGVQNKCTFIRENSFDVRSPAKADIVISETLGNFALEEHTLEILQDAKRFLAPGGSIIPQQLKQIVTPVINPNFLEDLQSWRNVGYDLTFGSAEFLTLQNLYVRTFKPEDLLGTSDARKTWDTIDFAKRQSSIRKKRISWSFKHATSVSGFCLSWEVELVPGVTLATHPWSPLTHWEQIYLPSHDLLQIEPGDEVILSLESNTSLSIGLQIQWIIEHRRGSHIMSKKEFDMQKGFLA